jgi:hypothetical protein
MFVSFHDTDQDAAGRVPVRQITVRKACLSRSNETVFELRSWILNIASNTSVTYESEHKAKLRKYLLFFAC